MYFWIPEWALVVAALAVAVYFWGNRNYNYFKNANIPYDPPTFLLGNLGPAMLNSQSLGDFIKDYYFKFTGSNVAGLFNFSQPGIMLRGPELIKEVAVKGFDHFTDHTIPITEKGDPLFAGNLFSLKGDRWKYMRHTLSPAFTSSKMKSMFILVEKCGEQMAQHLTNKCKETSDGVLHLEMKEFFTRYTNDVIATAAFGIHVDSLAQPDNEFYAMGKDCSNFDGIKTIIFICYSIMPAVMTYFRIPLFSGKVSTFFRSLVHETIATREKEGIIRPDMIHLLMQARKGTLKSDSSEENATSTSSTNKSVLSDDQVTAQALLFFLAGFDTSSTLISLMSHMLAINPDEQKKVQEEVDALLKTGDGNITYEGIQGLKYLDMVISETLRLWPPVVGVDRTCVRPYVLAATDKSPEIKFRVGDAVLIPIYGLHRDPEYFPDPDSFIPERFSEENKHKIDPFTYLPFGVGPRNCIGMRFAQMEAKIAMVHLLSSFDLLATEKTSVNIVLEGKGFANLVVKGGSWLGIKLRNKP